MTHITLGTGFPELTKEYLLYEIYQFCKKRGKNVFYKDAFVIHLWFKYKYLITLEQLFPRLRELCREGFLIKFYKKSPRNPRVKLVFYMARMNYIKYYLSKMGIKVD